jgi:hypothetical protein
MALNRQAPEDNTDLDARTPQRVEDVVDGEISVPTDNKGRPLPEVLTDRALLIEIATHQRVMYDAITALGSNPMLAAFMPPGIPRG